MNRLKIALLPFLVIIALLPSASASYAKGYIVVAWDEEFDAHGLTKYVFMGFPIPLDSKQYIDWQMSRALYWFHKYFGVYVNFEIIGYTTWDSYDYYTLPQMLTEAITETGFESGLYFNGIKATVLIAFTSQQNDALGGGCIPNRKALIIRHQEEWADDNLIMHELTHLYQEEHCLNDDCVMSNKETFIGFYQEPMAPEWGEITLSLYQTQHWSYFAYDWCDECKARITNHLSHLYPPPPDPWSEALKPPGIERILFWIAFTSSIILIVVLVIKVSEKIKKPKILTNTKSGFYPANCYSILQTALKIGEAFTEIKSDKIYRPTHYQEPIFWELSEG